MKKTIYYTALVEGAALMGIELAGVKINSFVFPTEALLISHNFLFL